MMAPLSPPRRARHSLNDVARQIAPHLRIISASRPTPVLRNHNVIAVAENAEAGREAVLALESIETDDDKLGTVVMGAAPTTGEGSVAAVSGEERPDPEGVSRLIIPRVLSGGIAGALAGALLVGGGAYLLGATGWRLVGAALGGMMLLAVFGAMWMTFAGFGGTDAYRQTWVDEAITELTIVSVHTDDPEEAAAAHDRLDDGRHWRVFDIDRHGHVTGGRY
jgi:hypothetical protein